MKHDKVDTRFSHQRMEPTETVCDRCHTPIMESEVRFEGLGEQPGFAEDVVCAGCHKVDTIQVGDQIKFRVLCRWGRQTATRKVRGFWPDNPFEGPSQVTVQFNCLPNFLIRPSEILEVNPT